MTNESNRLRLVPCTVDGKEWPIVEFTQPLRETLVVVVRGEIANAAPDKKKKGAAQAWREQVASGVEAARNGQVWNSSTHYAISLGFRFYPGAHGHQPVDVDNFVKPVLDAVAKGLGMPWLPGGEWNYKDSDFKTLFIHQLQDATAQEHEGVAIAVSCPERSTL